MTTIAWDGKVLAGDRQRTFGGTPIPVTKVFRQDRYVFGCSGNSDECVLLATWLAHGMPVNDKPKCDDVGALLVRDSKLYYITSPHLLLLEIDAPFFAIGSGADYALGAMAMGADAATAVKVAAKLDVNTGMGVDCVTAD